MQETRQETTTTATFKPPISRAGRRQIGRLAKLRNECNTPKKLYLEIVNDPDLNPPHTNQTINQILQPATPITTKEAHHQCSKAIENIIRKASHMLTDKLRQKENKKYDKSPKHYHNNLKISADINPRARDQPRVTALTHPSTNESQTTPQEFISIVTKHYELEQKRATPEHLPEAPWTQPQHPCNFTMYPLAQINTRSAKTLDKYITKSHYDRAKTEPHPAKHPDQMQSRTRSSNTSRKKHTYSSTHYSN
jgi:hypothetical protein